MLTGIVIITVSMMLLRSVSLGHDYYPEAEQDHIDSIESCLSQLTPNLFFGRLAALALRAWHPHQYVTAELEQCDRKATPLPAAMMHAPVDKALLLSYLNKIESNGPLDACKRRGSHDAFCGRLLATY